MPTNHKYKVCECGEVFCPICGGGLSICIVCNGAEGSLIPYVCPLFKLTALQASKVYEDYVTGVFDDKILDIDQYISELRRHGY